MIDDSLTRDLENSINPRGLKKFLAANRWSLAQDRVGWEVWRAPSDLELHPPVVIVPVDSEYVDYIDRLEEANRVLRRAYHLSEADLAEKITALNADLFFIRIDQDSLDGTISFAQARRALDNIATMVKAAATTASSPQHSHRGRRPSEVEEFLADDLRLGHTKKGSFVVTAAARLDWEEPETPPSLRATEQLASASEGNSQDAASEIVPFGRRVMVALSHGLNAARLAASTSESAMPIGEAVESGLSLEMAEALERIVSEDGLKSISVSFDWSESVETLRDDTPDVIEFTRDVIDEIPRVTEKLQLKVAPTAVELLGEVTELSRPVGDEKSTIGGSVVIYALIDDRRRKVRVPLNAGDYDLAVRAHLARIPITVSGDLVKKRSWELGGFVVLERRVLETLLAARSGNGKPGATTTT